MKCWKSSVLGSGSRNFSEESFDIVKLAISPRFGSCLWKNWSDLNENLLGDASLDREVPVKFWKSTGSGLRIRTRFTLAELCTVSSHTGLASVGEQIASRHVAIFGHIARLSEEVPAHQALRAHVDLSHGRLPGRDWKRRSGRPNNRWVNQVRNENGNMPSTLWRSAILRGHGTGVTQRPLPATRT